MTLEKSINEAVKSSKRIIDNISPKITEVVDDYNRDNDQWIKESIKYAFGDFIYKALGNVNSSLKVKDYPNPNKPTHYGYWEKRRPGFIRKIVVSKKFGFGIDGKKQTINMDSGDLFAGLIDAHSDLISRPSQQALVKDFLKFKKSYISKYNMIFNARYKCKIPVTVNKIYLLEVLNKTNVIIEDPQEAVVTGINVELPPLVYIDDKLDRTQLNFGRSISSSCQGPYTKHPTITFIGYIPSVSGGVIIPLAKFDFNITASKKLFEDAVSQTFSGYMLDKSFYRIVNVHELLQNKTVKDIIYNYINFNKAASKSLTYLKLKYAKNIFLNGAF